MKMVAIIDSPRGMAGDTGRVLRALLNAMEAKGSATRVFSLDQMLVLPCHNCGTCLRTGACVLTDDFTKIQDAMLSADAIVLASSASASGVSSQMQTFLNRLCAPLYCQAMGDKYGTAVVTSDGSGTADVEQYLSRFLRAMGCWTEEGIGVRAVELKNPDRVNAALEAAARLGAELAEDVREQPAFPEQDEERSLIAERMERFVTSLRDDWPFVYAYRRRTTRGRGRRTPSRRVPANGSAIDTA
jgi:multimeric flavodoxin WrbA